MTPPVSPWIEVDPVTPSPELVAAVGGHPLVAQILAQRGFTTPDTALPFLDPSRYEPRAPHDLYGLAQAAELILAAIDRRQKILVWGDFDVDGQTSTALLVAALRDLAGPGQVRFHIPNRFDEGHGIHLHTLERKLTGDAAWRPELLLTCDTGITEAAAVGVAKDAGLIVVITDHHDLPPELKQLGAEPALAWGQPVERVGRESVRRADAIVNPKLQPDHDPLRTLPGVGVAYTLIQQIYHRCHRAGAEETYLDLVALGIVADVAEQVHDTRYLLQRGLEQLRVTERAGLKALMETARVNPDRVGAAEIGFQLGPRMNALGRLEDATEAVTLLTTVDLTEARALAARLELLNQQRRLETSQTLAAALNQIEHHPQLLQFRGLVLSHPDWHAGIVGIVASRLAELYNRPTVLLLTSPDGRARGSARSVPGVDMGAAIAACSHLLTSHGGHAGAAGLSLPVVNIDHFRRELDRQIELHSSDSGPSGLQIDAEVPFPEINLTLAADLQRLAPFGNGNPEPVLASLRLEVVEDRAIGRSDSHRQLLVRPLVGGEPLPVIWFHGAEQKLPAGPIDLAYLLKINDFRGERTLQLHYMASRAASLEPAEDLPCQRPARILHDLRAQPVESTALPQPPHAIWYAEGELPETVPYAPRSAVHRPSQPQPLVLWSAPPSSQLLTWLIEQADPSEIYLCGQPPGFSTLQTVTRGVAGMVKRALANDRRLDLGRMAARLATTEAVVRHSLFWLAAQGQVQLGEPELDGTLLVAVGSGHTDTAASAARQQELQRLLEEIGAYRRFLVRARPQEMGLC